MSAGLLLDTCAFVWMAVEPSSLSRDSRAAISAEAAYLYVSAITAFEIGLKHSIGGLDFPEPLEKWFRNICRHHSVRVVPVTARIAIRSTQLPRLHKDPADRIILATAEIRRLRIVTPDGLIRAYPDAAVVW